MVQPDGHQFQRVLAAVAQLAGVGGLFADGGRARRSDDVRGGGQDAIGRGVALPRQSEGVVAVVVGAQQDDEVGGADGLGGLLPHLGVDRPAAREVDVGAEQAEATGVQCVDQVCARGGGRQGG